MNSANSQGGEFNQEQRQDDKRETGRTRERSTQSLSSLETDIQEQRSLSAYSGQLKCHPTRGQPAPSPAKETHTDAADSISLARLADDRARRRSADPDLVELATQLARPTAIVAVSAHWTTQQPDARRRAGERSTTSAAPRSALPVALPGAQHRRWRSAHRDAAHQHWHRQPIDQNRGLDHGAWVPLRTLFPAADIPVPQPLDSARSRQRATTSRSAPRAPLAAEQRADHQLSGHLTHNLGEYMRGQPRVRKETIDFRNWVPERLLSGDNDALLDWLARAPWPRFITEPGHFTRSSSRSAPPGRSTPPNGSPAAGSPKCSPPTTTGSPRREKRSSSLRSE